MGGVIAAATSCAASHSAGTRRKVAQLTPAVSSEADPHVVPASDKWLPVKEQDVAVRPAAVCNIGPPTPLQVEHDLVLGVALLEHIVHELEVRVDELTALQAVSGRPQLAGHALLELRNALLLARRYHAIISPRIVGLTPQVLTMNPLPSKTQCRKIIT